MPVDYFPSSILQNGVKMTTEPPQGLKANLKRIFTNIIDKEVFDSALISMQASSQFKGLDKNTEIEIGQVIPQTDTLMRPSMLAEFERRFELVKCWKSLLFGLSFFHSVIQERKKFGSIGWNKKYEFNDSDLETSVKMLQNFLFDAEEIPFDSMQFMTGHINYGGRVTDDNDRVLLICMLRKCYGQLILDPTLTWEPDRRKRKRTMQKMRTSPGVSSQKFNFNFFGCKQYMIPRLNSSLEEVQTYIDSLPDSDMPQLFGMHRNADIAY
jgi:dynein heavy chain